MTISECILHRKAAFREIPWVQAFHSSVLVFSQGNQILHSTYDHTEILHDFTYCETHPSSQ